MWEVLERTPLGSTIQRKFVTFVTSLLVASFGYLLLATPQASAISDGQWTGEDTLSYRGLDYKGPITAEQNDRSTLPKGTIYFVAADTANVPAGQSTTGYLLYFPAGTDLSKAKSATYRQGDYDISTGQFSNLTDPDSGIDVNPDSWGSAPTLQPTTCDVDGIGWLVCPVSGYIAKGMDYLYTLLGYFLRVEPITDTDNSIYQMWGIVRSVANICFIIGFLIIIYAQISGAFMSNYTLKKLLPRIIIAALLVNVSYWICSIGVDISNILGASVQDVFQNLQQQVGAANSVASDVSWEAATAFALGGGAIGLAGLAGATAFGGGAMAFLLLGALIPALFAVFVAVAILAARQALITILIVLSPLAFVAYLLPNTEDTFNRWRKLFMNLLIIFPAFSVIFGASQLTGVLIIQNATIFPVVILGLLVQVAPLFITPFLIRLSSGLLSTIAGLTNDRSKGVFDRAKNWTNDNREFQKSRAIKKGLDPSRFGEGTSRRRKALNGLRPTSAGARMAMSGDKRKRLTDANMAAANARYNMTKGGRKVYDAEQDGAGEKHSYESMSHERYQTAMATGTDKKNVARRALHHQGVVAQGKGDLYQDNMNKHAEQDLQETIRDDVTLSALRISTIAHEGLANEAKKRVEAEGDFRLQETIFSDSGLRDQARMTHEYQGRASQAKDLVEDGSKAAWEQLSMDDHTIYSRQLERQANAKQLKSVQDEWEAILVEASAGRTDDYEARHGSPTNEVETSVQRIQRADEQISVQARRKENAEHVAKSELTERFKTDDALLTAAAGIDQYGKTKVVAQLYKEKSALHMQNVEAVESVFTNEGYDPLELIKVYQKGELRNGEEATAMHVHAAIRQLALDKGNNTSVQKMVDFMAEQGMDYDMDTGTYTDQSGNELETPEVERRRDLQQIFRDAMNKSGHEVTHLSGTDKSALENGTYKTGTKNAIFRDIATGKIKADRIGKMDIDEMMRSLQVFRDNPGDLAGISTDNRQAYLDTINAAMTDPIIGARLETRHVRALNAMKLYINPNGTPPATADELDQIAGRHIPTQYDPATIVDKV